MAEAASPIRLSVEMNAPQVEEQLVNDYYQGVTSGVITKLYSYLAENANQKSGGRELQRAIPTVAGAVQMYQSGNFQGAFQQAYAAYRFITVLRSHHPELPPLALGTSP
jgi:predicted phage tail protein